MERKREFTRALGKSPLLPLGAGTIKYYHFSQNNSGGRWKVDDDFAEDVIITARTVDEANRRAEDVGIYFDGCNSDRDCNCCGDRWYPQYQESESVEPTIHGMSLSEYISDSSSGRAKIIIHHSDGTRETLTATKPVT